MNKKIEELLKTKPSAEAFENSVKVSKNFWENAMRKQCMLVEKQGKENMKLKPFPELYKKEFTL